MNIEILDYITTIQQKHDTVNRLLSILANKYFNNEPSSREDMLLFAKDYNDMSELITAVLDYNNTVKDILSELEKLIQNTKVFPIVMESLQATKTLVTDALQEYCYINDAECYAKYNFKRISATLEAVRTLNADAIRILESDVINIE